MRRLIRCLIAIVLLTLSQQALAHAVPHVHHHVNQVTQAHSRPHTVKHHRKYHRYVRHRVTHTRRHATTRHFTKSRTRSLANIPPIPHVNLLPPRQSAEYVEQRRSVECMARVMYYEARGEGTVGMAAVGYVVMNRLKSSQYPGTICGVVGQSVVKKGKRLYQFSWAGSPPRIHSAESWEKSLAIARQVLQGTIPNPVGHALWFNVKWLHVPYGRHMYALVIGNHRFLSPIPFNQQAT